MWAYCWDRLKEPEKVLVTGRESATDKVIATGPLTAQEWVFLMDR